MYILDFYDLEVFHENRKIRVPKGWNNKVFKLRVGDVYIRMNMTQWFINPILKAFENKKINKVYWHSKTAYRKYDFIIVGDSTYATGTLVRDTAEIEDFQVRPLGL